MSETLPARNQPDSHHIDTPSLAMKYLNSRIEQMIDHYPDIHMVAEEAARAILRRLAGSTADPFQVYWHAFNHTHSSPRTYTGWEHYGTPEQSMNLVELVMRRFTITQQRNSDTLSQMGGFYTSDASAQMFNETNEVRLDPQRVLDEFWKLDFPKLYKVRLKTFWINQQSFCYLVTKVGLLVSAVSECQKQFLRMEDYLVLYEAVVNDVSTPFTPGKMRGDVMSYSNTEVTTFEYEGLHSTSALRFMTTEGRQILYCPDDEVPFVAFDTPEQLYLWVQRCVSDKSERERFMRKFVCLEHDQQAGWDVLDAKLAKLAVTRWDKKHNPFNTAPRRLDGYRFNYLADCMKTKMEQDARYLLMTNAKLTEALWIGYLDSFIKVYGGLSMLGWPIAAITVVAGASSVGLYVHKALYAVNARERREAIRGAALNTLNTVLTLPLLNDAMPEELEAIEDDPEAAAEIATNSLQPTAPQPAHDAQSIVASLRDAGDVASAQALDEMRPVVILASDLPTNETGALGSIYLRNGDEAYTLIAGVPYRVRYINSLKHWAVVDPMNPYAFDKLVPIALDTQGQWQVGNRLRLLGGGDAQPLDVWPLSRQTGMEPVALQPMETTVRVTVPLDNVERLLGSYMVRTRARGRLLAAYDVDKEAWRINHLGMHDFLWRAADGLWEFGTEEQWIKGSKSSPPARYTETMVLPPLPQPVIDAAAIPKLIHYIWVGDTLPNAAMIKNIIRNADKMKGYQSIIHVDLDQPGLVDELTEHFKSAANCTVKTLEDQPFFRAFRDNDTGKQYRLCRQGVARNYSAASDVVRYPLLDAYGGIYMDTDNSFKRALDNIDLLAAPNDVLLDDAVSFEKVHFHGYNSHVLGSHPNNPVLKLVTRTMQHRFRENPAFYSAARPVLEHDTPAPQAEAFWKYMNKVFHLTGPKLLNDVLRAFRSDYFDLALRDDLTASQGLMSMLYEQRLQARVAHYCPFSETVEVVVGNSHSWMMTR